MSATRLESGSQVTPYQLVQQSSPDHVLKIPRYGSLSDFLKSSNAARSEGGQASAVNVRVRRSVRVVSVSFPGRFIFGVFVKIFSVKIIVK